MTDDVNPMHADPRQVVASDWPANGTADDRLLFLLNYAVLAPSILNAQPWRFSIGGGVVELGEDRGRRLKVVDPEGREAAISCGAALFNLCIAARSFGLEPEIELLGEAAAPAVARVRLGQQSKPASAEDQRLRNAIPERRTSRGGFEERKVPREVLRRLENAAVAEGARFAWTDAVARRREIAAVVAEAERAHLSNPDYRDELRNWLLDRRRERHESLREAYYRMGTLAGRTAIHPRGSDEVTMEAASLGRAFASEESAAARLQALVVASPVVAVVSTASDTPTDWLRAGLALERVLLTATAEGLSASFLNAPTELKWLRNRLGSHLGAEGHPQVLMRLGYHPPVSATPRRPLAEVVSLSTSSG